MNTDRIDSAFNTLVDIEKITFFEPYGPYRTDHTPKR